MDKIIDPERAGQLARDAARAAGRTRVDETGGQRIAHRTTTCRLTLLMLALLALAEGGGAAPLLEKGEKLFRAGRRGGGDRGLRRGGQGRSQGRAPALPEGRRAGEEGRRRRRDRGLQGRRSRARPTSPRRTTTWARCCWRKNDAAGRRRRVRGGGEGASRRTPRRSTTWASRATAWARSRRRSSRTRRRCA